MKKSQRIALLFIVLLMGFTVSGMSKVPGGGGADMSEFEAETQVITNRAYIATEALVDAYIFVYEATGKKEAAERARTAMKNAKDLEDKNAGLKALNEEANNAGAEISEIDLEASMDEAIAKEKMGEAYLKTGKALIYDALVVNDTKTQLEKCKTALETLKADPMKNAGNIKMVKGTMEVLAMLSKNVPMQIKSTATLSANMASYSKAHNIELPSKEDIQKEADTMEKG